MTVWNLRPGRLACAVALCLLSAPAWSALGATISYRSGAAAIEGCDAERANTLDMVVPVDSSCWSIAAAPECGDLVLLAEVSALGLACLLVCRRKAELAAFRSWFADVLAEQSRGTEE